MTDYDQFDRLLDKALSEYGNVSPREGLEQRLLARLAEQGHDRDWRWRWLWAAVPIMAAILIIIFLAARPTARRDTDVATAPSLPTSTTAVSAQSPAPHAAALVTPRRVHTTAAVVRKERANVPPKLATFPSPDGSEQQASLLLRFVTRSPDEAVQVASEQEEFQKLTEARMNQDLEDRSER